MAEVNLRSWPEISQAADSLQLNPTNAMLEHILATMAHLESKLDERNRRLGITISLPRPEPDPPDAPQPYFPNQPPASHNINQQPPSPFYQTYATFDATYTALEPLPYQPYPTFDATCITFEPPPYVAPDSYARYHTGQREYQPTPPPYQPQGPSCWDSPAPAFEQPYFYMDSHAMLRNPYAGDHRGQPDYQPPQLPYTGSESHVQPRSLEADVSGGRKTSWFDISPYVESYEEKNVNKPVDQQRLPNITCSKKDLVDNLWCRGDKLGQSSTELHKECHVKTIASSARGDTSPSDDSVIVVVDSQVGNDITTTLKQQVDVVDRAIFLGKNQRATDNVSLIGSFLEALIEQEIYTTRKMLGGEMRDKFSLQNVSIEYAIVGYWGTKQRSFAFDPGGNTSPKLLFATLFVVSWFPP